MSGKGTVEPEKEKAGAANPMASSCGCMTMAKMHEGCGSEMQGMMSRFMASFGAARPEPPKCGEEEGDNGEDNK